MKKNNRAFDKENKVMLTHKQLVMKKFRKHKLARVSIIVLILLYVLCLGADFFAPYGGTTRFSSYASMRPTKVHWFRDGRLTGPFVYGIKSERNMETLAKEFVEDTDTVYRVKIFVRGESYRFLGIPMKLRLFGVEDGGLICLFGTDSLGRDVFSRTLYGGRLSLSIGLVGVFISMIIGLTLGSIAGYYGGTADAIIMRLVDLFMSLPTTPLWLGLAAAVPTNWSVVKMYFAMSIILSFFGWTNIARTVRGKFLSLREEDFILASRMAGATDRHIITSHMIPSFVSYIIVSLTLSIPRMIIGETTLSFLGLGLQAPAVSWGVLLKDAQNFRSISGSPWLLLPGIFVILTVLAFNFVGDGLRDAADPYSH